jgi:hypothetical protein
MPSPKNRMKSTGDTHLPEVELDMTDLREPADASDEEKESGRVFADGYVPPGSSAGSADAARAPLVGGASSMADSLREQTARSPLLVAGAMLAAGYVLVKLLRR